MPDPLRFPVPESFATPRLILRPFSVADAPQLFEALVESIEALRAHLWFLPWVAEQPTLASAEARCRQAQASFLLRTDLPYLAFERRSGRLVASAGLHRTDWSLPKTEVGYWVRTSEVGKGYASEAVQALTAWALEGLGACRVELVTDELNLGFAGGRAALRLPPRGHPPPHDAIARRPAAQRLRLREASWRGPSDDGGFRRARLGREPGPGGSRLAWRARFWRSRPSSAWWGRAERRSRSRSMRRGHGAAAKSALKITTSWRKCRNQAQPRPPVSPMLLASSQPRKPAAATPGRPPGTPQ